MMTPAQIIKVAAMAGDQEREKTSLALAQAVARKELVERQFAARKKLCADLGISVDEVAAMLHGEAPAPAAPAPGPAMPPTANGAARPRR